MRYYAEYLPNVGQVSVTFQGNDGSDVVARPDSVTIGKDTVPLPAEIQVREMPPVGRLSTLRFRASPDAAHTAVSDQIDSIHIDSPYGSSFVRKLPKATLLCDHTDGSPILTAALDTFRLRNMPSEHWAEMMDFWHCHKPHEKSAQFNPAYAVSQFKPNPGEILFGQEYIMVNKEDMRLEHNAVGKEEGDSFKIPKWNMQFNCPDGEIIKVDPVQVLLFSMSELTNSHASHQFLLCDETQSDDDVKPAALVWIFNRNLTYTLSGVDGKEQGTKIYYTVDPALVAELSEGRDQVEQVFYPKWVLDTFIGKLQSSNALLPEQSKMFLKWHMGLLDGKKVK
ncbi:ubiquitin-conjugating enzyme E2-binding protein [Yarrowia lipolytica]|jgi:hypothetical protein|uniref:Ubiquitin-conjugating enzyme E2-binding protein n=1 Tax=Yarrowia lipolytica TaxID=4952 RepID=A0A371C1E1_YARLL|nr:Hypothetical protein YALI2_D00231g [Yarrowia lipolytica]RDW23740.1 ubiquitin-conjugating enzyme E2-binding protein [Yarrowia lipolytica]RDW33393.1 ubiquitin-conjugating enzyme E2-binding protein [Yarrowia lipolytica]SEI36556.1 YALIA101S12e02520g1_1 [Yarrowia lipolytica]